MLRMQTESKAMTTPTPKQVTQMRCKRPECEREIDFNMCQQGGYHVSCFSYPIDVWKVEHDGSSFYDDKFKNLVNFLEDAEIGTSYTITKEKMELGVYENLPEFNGF